MLLLVWFMWSLHVAFGVVHVGLNRQLHSMSANALNIQQNHLNENESLSAVKMMSGKII